MKISNSLPIHLRLPTWTSPSTYLDISVCLPGHPRLPTWISPSTYLDISPGGVGVEGWHHVRVGVFLGQAQFHQLRGELYDPGGVHNGHGVRVGPVRVRQEQLVPVLLHVR